MRACAATLVIGLVGGVTRPARAEPPAPRFEAAAGVGYGWPFGNVLVPQGKGFAPAESPLSSFVTGMVPVSLQLGARLRPYVEVGADGRLGLGPGMIDLAVGLHVQIHPWPESWVDPWCGIGPGVELIGIDGLQTNPAQLEGNVQIGLDVHAGPMFALGPVLSGSVSSDNAGNGASSTYEWVTVGVRVDFMAP
jgi:hypothetical protein